MFVILYIQRAGLLVNKLYLYNKKGVEETVFSFTPFLFAKVKYVGRIHVPFRSIYYLL